MITRLPADLRKATKAALIDVHQRALAELAEANDLLRAISEMADSPLFHSDAPRLLGRIQQAARSAAADSDYRRNAGSLRALLADDLQRAQPVPAGTGDTA